MRKLFKNKWLLGITAVGILLLLFGASGGLQTGASPGPMPTGATPAAASVSQSGSGAAVRAADAYESDLDHQLEQIINQIAGVSDALVMVRVDSTTAEQVGQDVTSSRSTTEQGTGSGRSTTVTTQNQSQLVTVTGGSGAQIPVVVLQSLPHIVGVLVVARAADAIAMEAEITGAVQDVLGIPAYEVTVLPRK
ncbi:MAG: hypothetical protein OWU32_06085 [Firmicutes bacterium]|nr:hypothetical protein [Bacillota bacterium]